MYSITNKRNSDNNYQITTIYLGRKNDYFFKSLDEAVLCFYGKITEVRSRYDRNVEFLMSLFGPCGDILINYHRDINEDKCMDLRPNTI